MKCRKGTLDWFCIVEDKKCRSAETHGYPPVIKEGGMETPLGGKGWGPHLLLQGIFSVPGTAQKVGAKSHTTTALTHRQPCLSLLTPLCFPHPATGQGCISSPRAVSPCPCNTPAGPVSMPGHGMLQTQSMLPGR